MPRRASCAVFAAVTMLSLAGGTRATEKVPAPAVALDPGDYELVLDQLSRATVGQPSKGRLVLRELRAGHDLRSRGYRLYGWTDVDLKRLRAPLDASSTPGDSRDPDSPGVLVLVPSPQFNGFGVAQPSGAPIVLIGTVDNKKATRGWEDGGGIGLFVQSKDGRCVSGEWTNWGIVRGGRGRFRICALESKAPPNPALNPTGLRPAG
jgi:hypothetical protein